MQASIYQFINLNWLCLGHPFQQLNIEESGTETTDKHLTQTRFFLGTLWIPWCDIRLTFIKSNFSVEHSISFPQNVTNWCDHTSSQHRNKKEGWNGSQTTFNHFLLVKKIKEQTKNWHTHTQKYFQVTISKHQNTCLNGAWHESLMFGFYCTHRLIESLLDLCTAHTAAKEQEMIYPPLCTKPNLWRYSLNMNGSLPLGMCLNSTEV